ncbi:TerB family tellurite resistance protein [Gammaproteobacteria bacterium]|nr:TerB family tellurite resistance protein [Gammaproteobacteria bacterium]
MMLLKSAIGYLIGFSLGGPIGGLIGAIAGSRVGVNQTKSKTRFTSNQQQQAAFFAALFACLAKLAKADGIVSKEEVEKVDDFIKERFKFPSEQRKFAIKVFNHAKDDNVSYEEYASQLAGLLAKNKNALVVFYELLFELAMADGILDPAEEVLLRKTPGIFGIDISLFDNLKDQFSSDSSDPYKVLGVSSDMPFDDIKKIYQKKRREFHPDTLISKGLPDELLDKAKEKFIEIQQAFEVIEKKNSN